jgi:glutaminase
MADSREPGAEVLARVVQEAFEKFRDVRDGAPADYIPELARVEPDKFGVAIVTAGGAVYVAGDVGQAFTIQSVSKPFTAALVMQDYGSANVIAEKIGVEPTGQKFNSILATQIIPQGRQCSIGVNAKQLAVMGATLANGGVNPVTGKRVLEARYVPKVLAIMMTAGFYNESGLWAYTAGLPAKTGVGGGIVAVVPGKMAIVGFSPRVNDAGNSIRAMRAIEYISDQLEVNVFGSGR